MDREDEGGDPLKKYVLPFLLFVALIATGVFADSAVSAPAPTPVRDYKQPMCPQVYGPPGTTTTQCR